jgi:PilZ domain
MSSRRKHPRVDFCKAGFVILEPDAPWIECAIADISEGGVRLNIGALVIPQVFVLVLNPSGSVRRACRRVWRRGEWVGARFVSAKELRDGVATPAPIKTPGLVD